MITISVSGLTLLYIFGYMGLGVGFLIIMSTMGVSRITVADVFIFGFFWPLMLVFAVLALTFGVVRRFFRGM